MIGKIQFLPNGWFL